MIRKLHFIWVDKFNFENVDFVIPEKYRLNIEKWRQLHPDWTIEIWNGERILNMIDQVGDLRVYDMFHNYKNFICKLDLARVLILFAEGGLYIDLDTYCERDITALIESCKDNELTLVKEPAENVKNYQGLEHMKEYVVSNSFLYSPTKHNQLFLGLIGLLISNAQNESQHILLATGPPIYNAFYQQVERESPGKIKLLDSKGILEKSPDGFMYTTFDNTWCDSDTWNNKIFDDFYFYPTLDIEQFPFRNIPPKILMKAINTQETPLLAFNTDGQTKLGVPPLQQLKRKYTSEFSGVFIRKASFKRTEPIPKKIHQIWIGEKRPPLEYTETVRLLNPDWEYKLWDEKSLRQEIPEAFDDPIYNRVSLYCSKVDILRIYLLYKHGGLYLDCDFKWLKPLDDDMRYHNFFLAFSSELHQGLTVNNNVIGCHRKSPIMKQLLDEMHRQHPDTFKAIEDIYTTSPGFYTGFVARHPEHDIFIYPSYFFFRTSKDIPRENCFLNTCSYADHVGRYDPNYVCTVDLNLEKRDGLGTLLNRLGLTNKGAEVGVLRGGFSNMILSQWTGKKLYLVDCWEHQDDKVYIDTNNGDNDRHNFNLEVTKRIVSKYPGRYEFVKDYSLPASKRFADGELDFVYIDARHDYDGVTEDLEAWYPKVKSGGLISGHDLVPDEFLEHARKFGAFDVKRALVDFIVKHSIQATVRVTYKDDIYQSFYFIKP